MVHDLKIETKQNKQANKQTKMQAEKIMEMENLGKRTDASITNRIKKMEGNFRHRSYNRRN